MYKSILDLYFLWDWIGRFSRGSNHMCIQLPLETCTSYMYTTKLKTTCFSESPILNNYTKRMLYLYTPTLSCYFLVGVKNRMHALVCMVAQFTKLARITLCAVPVAGATTHQAISCPTNRIQCTFLQFHCLFIAHLSPQTLHPRFHFHLPMTPKQLQLVAVLEDLRVSVAGPRV